MHHDIVEKVQHSIGIGASLTGIWLLSWTDWAKIISTIYLLSLMWGMAGLPNIPKALGRGVKCLYLRIKRKCKNLRKRIHQ